MTCLRKRASHPRVSAILLAAALAWRRHAAPRRHRPRRASIWREWTSPSRRVTISTPTPTAAGSRQRPFPPTSRVMAPVPYWPTRRGNACARSFRSRPTRPAATGDARKIGDYYATFMDEAAIESKGIAAAEAPTRRHRGHRGSPRSRPRVGRAVARGCGSVEQHQLRDRQPLRSLDRTGPGRPVAQFPLSAAGRSRHARPRLLYLHQRPHGRSAQAIPGAHRDNVQAGGLHGPVRPRRPRVRARNQNGAGARHARGVGGRACRGLLESERTGSQSSRARLAGAARCRRIARRLRLHDLAPQSRPRTRRFSRRGASRRMEGLARAPCHRTFRRLPPESLRRRALRLLRQGPQRNSGIAPAMAAGNGLHQRCSGRGSRQGLRGTLLPGRHQSQGAGDGRRSGAGVRQENRRPRLDVPGRPKPKRNRSWTR